MLLNLLGTDWEPIITGLEKGMEFNNDYHGKFPDDIESIVWNKLLHAYEVSNHFERYGYVCIGNFKPIENGISAEILNSLEPEDYDLPDEGMFLCIMKDKQYGFFSARNGSCGYNTCPVGGSYASFYVGSYEDVCNLGMDNEARHWNKM